MRIVRAPAAMVLGAPVAMVVGAGVAVKEARAVPATTWAGSGTCRCMSRSTPNGGAQSRKSPSCCCASRSTGCARNSRNWPTASRRSSTPGRRQCDETRGQRSWGAFVWRWTRKTSVKCVSSTTSSRAHHSCGMP